MIYGTSDGLMEDLSEGRVDFILSFIHQEEPTLFESIILFESTLSLIVPKNHSIAKKTSIKLAEIQRFPIALPVNNFSIRSFLDAQVVKQKVNLDIRLEANDINTLLQLAEHGTWCTILMVSSVFNFANLKAIPISGKEMVRKASIAWPKNTYQKKAAKIFIEIIQVQVLGHVLV